MRRQSLASPVPDNFMILFNELQTSRNHHAPSRCARFESPPECGAGADARFRGVIDKRFLDDLSARIDETLRGSPAQDIEKNLKALLASWFDRLDLVLREDFEVQKKLLERAQAKLAELDARIAELEARKPR